MPDLVITPADVKPAAGLVTKSRLAAVAIAAGDIVFIDSSNQLDLAQAVADKNIAVGIALNSASPGQPCSYAEGGKITLGNAVMAGVAHTFALSATAGKIAPIADIVATDFLTTLGYSVDTDNLQLQVLATKLQKT